MYPKRDVSSIFCVTRFEHRFRHLPTCSGSEQGDHRFCHGDHAQRHVEEQQTISGRAVAATPNTKPPLGRLFHCGRVLFEALKSQSSGWSGLTLSAARYSMTRALQSGTGQLEAAATMLSRVPMPVAWRSFAGLPRASPDVLLRRKLRPYAAAPLRWHCPSELGASLYARSMIGTSRSGSSLFITYSSTNHRIRSGISQCAESRMIGGWGTVA